MYRFIFLDPRALPTLIIGKETVPSRDIWNLKLHLRVCSWRARGSNPLALKAQSWFAPQAHLALWLFESSCVCPMKPSRLRLFSPPPKKLHAQDMARFGMFPRLKRLAQSDSSRVSTHFVQEGFTTYWTSSPSRRGSSHKFQWWYHSSKETTFSRLLHFGHLTSRELFGLCRESGSISPCGVAASGGSTRPSQLRQEGCRRTKWNPIGPRLT